MTESLVTKYKADPINITNTIFGLHFEDYYKALETYDVPNELKERVIRFEKKVYTIGNYCCPVKLKRA